MRFIQVILCHLRTYIGRRYESHLQGHNSTTDKKIDAMINTSVYNSTIIMMYCRMIYFTVDQKGYTCMHYYSHTNHSILITYRRPSVKMTRMHVVTPLIQSLRRCHS